MLLWHHDNPTTDIARPRPVVPTKARAGFSMQIKRVLVSPEFRSHTRKNSEATKERRKTRLGIVFRQHVRRPVCSYYPCKNVPQLLRSNGHQTSSSREAESIPRRFIGIVPNVWDKPGSVRTEAA